MKFNNKFNLHEKTGEKPSEKVITSYDLKCIYCNSDDVVLRDFHVSNLERFGLDFYCKSCERGFLKYHDVKLELENKDIETFLSATRNRKNGSTGNVRIKHKPSGEVFNTLYDFALFHYEEGAKKSQANTYSGAIWKY
jgi:hypothetical protein